MRRFLRTACACMVAIIALAGVTHPGIRAAVPRDSGEPGIFVRALWLVQRFGTAEAIDPRRDSRTKGAVAKALGKESVLTLAGAKSLMDGATFNKLAGADGILDPAEVRMALEADLPLTRSRLLPRVRSQAEFLTTSFDMIDGPHCAAGERLGEWIAANYSAGQPLHVVVVCTGNSRRSILARRWATSPPPTMVSPRSISRAAGPPLRRSTPARWPPLRKSESRSRRPALSAPRGEAATANPVYQVRWGRPGVSGEPQLETTEFSKRFSDPSNPQSGFAALMVCSEADEACPVVKGASVRISMPYLDPKIYDGSAVESAKYAERRDDIGRLMLAVMMQARHRLAAAGKLAVAAGPGR